MLEAVGDKMELARLSYEQGLMFKAKGDPAQARELLEKALAEYDRMGMKLWADKCRKALDGL